MKNKPKLHVMVMCRGHRDIFITVPANFWGWCRKARNLHIAKRYPWSEDCGNGMPLSQWGAKHFFVRHK